MDWFAGILLVLVLAAILAFLSMFFKGDGE